MFFSNSNMVLSGWLLIIVISVVPVLDPIRARFTRYLALNDAPLSISGTFLFSVPLWIVLAYVSINSLNELTEIHCSFLLMRFAFSGGMRAAVSLSKPTYIGAINC